MVDSFDISFCKLKIYCRASKEEVTTIISFLLTVETTFGKLLATISKKLKKYLESALVNEAEKRGKTQEIFWTHSDI